MTSDVKRYDPFGYDGLSALMHEDAHGDYVRLEDYDALLAERDALRDALNQIADYPDHDTLELKRIARAAMQGEQP